MKQLLQGFFNTSDETMYVLQPYQVRDSIEAPSIPMHKMNLQNQLFIRLFPSRVFHFPPVLHEFCFLSSWHESQTPQKPLKYCI